MLPPQKRCGYLVAGLGTVQISLGNEKVDVVFTVIRNQVVERTVVLNAASNGMGRALGDSHHFATHLFSVAQGMGLHFDGIAVQCRIQVLTTYVDGWNLRISGVDRGRLVIQSQHSRKPRLTVTHQRVSATTVALNGALLGHLGQHVSQVVVLFGFRTDP